jgi:hypothetical protein
MKMRNFFSNQKGGTARLGLATHEFLFSIRGLLRRHPTGDEQDRA